ncbi:MAG: MBOAT family protein [Dysgonamonadaceae bacterium]|jgi:D-alanyl-lipoteichoic acid acyltransferase DltB (MBOAT superfamily)|nr:MBOAT family protein [Dysgonamonadaceae bacterium]
MIFNSLDFAVFILVVFTLYWFVFNRNFRVQNVFIVVASYFFYGWWDWHFLIMITFTTLCSYYSGLLADKVRQSHGHSDEQIWYKNKVWWIIAANITVNLVILFYYKYYNFFVQNFVDAFSLFGKQLNISTLKIILPVGISFYTFQALSYSIDIYMKDTKPTRNIVAFFAYMSFFPKLTAGPVERANDLIPQFLKARKFDYPSAVDGLRQILWGLFKKIVVADNLAVCITYINSHTDTLPGSTLLLGSFFSVLQVYFDFSGYSDIAIGVARLLGINLSRNFNFPIFATSFANYWQRNHISMTRWFMDYIYYPMLGSSHKMLYWNYCVICTFLVSGLWHGANWTFILWGLIHGILISISTDTLKIQKKFEKRFHLKGVVWYKLIRISIIMFVLSIIGPLFSSESIHSAFDYIGKIFSSTLFIKPYGSTYAGKHVVFLVIICLLFEWFQQEKQHALQLDGVRSKVLRWAIYIFVIALIFNYGGVQVPFVYFQF